MRRFVLTGVFAIAATLLPPAVSAQSLPNINGIKQTTNRAVAKTNAHTLALTNPDSADTARAHGVRATASGAATRSSAEMDTTKIVLRREVFAYEQSGRRDPFVSLM